MNLIDPPGGKPWALLGLCAGSLLLNVVLIARIGIGGSDAVAAVALDETPAPAPELAPAVVEPAPVDAPAVEAAVIAPAPALPEGTRVVVASVESSLARTFQRAAPEHADVLSAVYARLFFFDLNLRTDLQAGDEVRVAYTWDGQLAHIPAATYGSKKLGRTLSAYQYTASTDVFPSWWDDSGQEMALRLVDGPIHDYEQITSLLKDRPRHHGMDFKAPEGTPIVAPKAGTVVRVNWNVANNGDCVELAFADGVHAKFLHLASVDVKAGQRVGKGETLGATGNTGHSTAPHLHYELDRNGTILDPVDYHGTVRRQLPDEDRAAFDEARAGLAALLQR